MPPKRNKKQGLNSQRRTRQGNLRAATTDFNALVNRVKGAEKIAAVAVQKDDAIQVIRTDAESLRSLAHPLRLNKYFDLYEKRFVHSIKLEFVPSLSKTAPGTIHMNPEYDSEDPPYPATSAEEYMSTNRHYVSAPVCEPVVCNAPNDKTVAGENLVPTLWNAPRGDIRLTDYCKFNVLLSGTGLSAGDVVGTLIMKYDISFICPAMEKHVGEMDSAVDRLVPVGLATTTSNASDSVMPLSDTTIGVSPRLYYSDNGGTAISANANHLLTGILDGYLGSSRIYHRGAQVPRGTRLYTRSAQSEDGVVQEDSNLVGGMWVSRNMTDADRVSFASSAIGGYANDAVLLRDVYRLISAYY